MDHISSNLPEEVQKLVRKNSVKKIIYQPITKNVTVIYVVETYDKTTNVYTGYKKYEYFYCSEKEITK